MPTKVLLIGALLVTGVSSECLGEFSECPAGYCSLGPCPDLCKAGDYLCPDSKTCVSSANEYTSCPGLHGTHLDWTLSTEARLDYLVVQATIEEKIAQLTNDAPNISRLGIPSYNWLNDDIHSVRRAHSTNFPDGCGLGATWSEEALRIVGSTVGLEARALHNGLVHYGNRGARQNGAGITIYSPNMNLVRDPRWGRSQEVYGEDPHLSSRLTVAYVTAAQTAEDPNHLLVGACCKHFAAYDVENIPAQRYVFDAKVDVRNMWETYMPAFQACVVEAKASHVMCSYNALNGIPTCGNNDLLNGLLREQWRWDGFVVSDYDAMAQIYETHKYVNSYEDAAATALNAGCDQEGGGTKAIDTLPAALKDNKTSEAVVNEAFRRLFRTRIRLGMLDPPTSVQYNYLKNDTSVLTPTSLKNALEVARQSICLYKNKDNILPLANNSAQSIGVFGASANESILLLGNYYTTPDYHIATILEALSASHPKVSYESGCTTIPCPTANFSAATALAAKSDVLVVVLGLDQSIEAEGHDREDLNLPGNQAALVAALRAAAPNKPLIGVLVHGGTLALGSVADQLDAIVDAWYPGMFGGQAIVDVLFGAYNPAGRTPVTWYKATSQLQPMGNMDLYAGNGTTYRYFRGDVTFPFGFGLSYTTFAYSNLRFESPNATACQNIGLTVTVTNTGKRDGDEVVQAYVRQPGASVPAPRIRLAAFSRVHLAAGASQTVTLTITPQYHSVVYSGADVFHPVQVVERGPIEIHVGGGQPQYYPGAVGGSINILDSRDIRDC